MHDSLNARIARQSTPAPAKDQMPTKRIGHSTSKADLDYTQGYDLGWQLGVASGCIMTTIAWMLVFLAVFLIAGVRVTVQ